MNGAALEIKIEAAWHDLTDRPLALYLLPWAGEYLIATNPKNASHVGTYTKAVTLAQFRADVFETLQAMRPA